MGAPRFYVDAALAEGASVVLPPAVAHHAGAVLRLRDGAPVVLFNGRGGEFTATLFGLPRQPHARVGRFDPVERESPRAVALLQAWIASERLDWLVEKAVELGVAALTLYPAARSVVRLAGERLPRRLAHLRAVAIRACEQSGRNRIPPIDAADSLIEALSRQQAQQRLLLAPGATPALVDIAGGNRSAAVLIGPEGGLDPRETSQVLAAGWIAAGLGPRILRTETAGLAALAALQAAGGDFGG